MPLHLSLRLCLVSCLWVLEIQVKLRTRLCLVSCLWMLESQSKKHNKQRFVRLCLVLCLWVLEIQAKNLEKEHTQIWNKKIWKCD
ncbi:hypothetical protein P8452_33375 [Trifolium repens]|nr:hypothetical protein P8452_33375 [Trifolium repens]